MKQNSSKYLAAVIAIFAAMLACNTSGNATEPPPDQPTELTTVIDNPPDSSTEVPIQIQHQVFPVNLPQSQSGRASDQDSSVTAVQKKSNGGDKFTFEQFERPFSSNAMDVYFPNLDIIDTRVFQDESWIYGTIKVVDRSIAAAALYRFGMQLDVQLDGKGDWLVLVLNPSSTDWTTDGVQVYFDANSDVGDLTPMLRDESAVGGDGFEQLVFDRGKGDDADAAWVRVSSEDPNTVEIAVKRSLLGNPAAFLANMWTGHGTLDPALFDYSDHFTHEQAGAADPGYPIFYPIKALYELDNSCRIAVGFQPKGNEPGLCTTGLAPSDPESGEPVCSAYGEAPGAGGCCDGVPISGGLCRYP
ncbi:MAG: hypothetical protein AB1607_12330 [Chloroflexota bacterium]